MPWSLPNCMQLILQFGCSRHLLNEVPNNLYLLLCTRLKALWVMEDKVASFICNLMLNVMYSSLKIQLVQSKCIHSKSLTHLNWWYQMIQKASLLHLGGTEYEKVHGISSNLPASLYMVMGCVPFATPQTFSRMVVLPALALPMTRIRKCGHLYFSLSIAISSTGATMY